MSSQHWSPVEPSGALPVNARLLVYVVRFTALHGRGPYWREVGGAMGWNSLQTVQYHLEDLRRAGLVTWARGRRGTLRPLVREVRS